MISAKDIFTLEREMQLDLTDLLNGSNLNHDEQQEIIDQIVSIESEADYDELQKVLRNRQIRAIDRIKNGEYVNHSQINEAVKQAAKNEQ